MLSTQELNHGPWGRAREKASSARLEDKKSNDKKRPWDARKRQSLAVAKGFQALGGCHQSSYERMCQCGVKLKFERLKHCESGDVRRRLHAARFCKQRLCPMCQWRRSILLHRQVTQVVETHLERRPTDRALMLTLTMRNCEAGELGDTISEMTKAFRRFMDYKPMERAVVGWFRSLEVTVSQEHGTYHPHLHVLLMVPGNYFSKKGPDIYLETEEIVALWKKALRVDYTPVCDVRRVGKGMGGDFWSAMKKGLLEVTKYCTKPDSWIDYRPDHPDNYEVDIGRLEALHYGLKHKRLVGWGGLLKDIFAELQLDDIEDDDADLVGKRDNVPEGYVHDGFEEYDFRNWLSHLPGAYYLTRRTLPDTGDPPD